MPKRPLVTISTLCWATTLSSAFLTPHKNQPIGRPLSGLPEWREDALASQYTLDAYQPPPNANHSPPTPLGTVPILPFPFSDILLPGQTKQLNLYEQRFHSLFDEVVSHNHNVVGMGLLAGTGMITTLPLCEVESFVRLGYDEQWVDRGDGMGNGSIFVTVRMVGRAKIVGELMQEEPYMKARVVEICDEEFGATSGIGGVKEKSSGVQGEASGLELASMVAGNIETLILSIASMEHRWKEWKEEMEKRRREKMVDSSAAEGEGGEMDRRIVNARLEALFMQETVEGVDLQNTEFEDEIDDDDDDDDDNNQEDDLLEETELIDRRTRFHTAFQNAKESDTYGYVTPSTPASDNLSKATIRTPKDLTALSWAAFCTADASELTEAEDMQHNVFKIQALDMTNVMLRLQLGAAMLRMEKKRWRAKLALAGMDKSEKEEES